MKLDEAAKLLPKDEYEEILKRFAKKTPGQFYGAQELLNQLWPRIVALEKQVKQLNDKSRDKN